MPGRKVPERRVSGGRVPGRRVPERRVPGGMIPGGMVPGRRVPGGREPGGRISGRSVPRRRVPVGRVPRMWGSSVFFGLHPFSLLMMAIPDLLIITPSHFSQEESNNVDSCNYLSIQ